MEVASNPALPLCVAPSVSCTFETHSCHLLIYVSGLSYSGFQRPDFSKVWKESPATIQCKVLSFARQGEKNVQPPSKSVRSKCFAPRPTFRRGAGPPTFHSTHTP
uniref:Uncharacterized protein n=1 Tax=Micrurus paraensis TaxID=1970185 RepID=A0A2D4KZ40_9SAUR